MPQENKDGMLAISVYLTPEQYDWLNDSAKADHRSRASLVRKIIAAAHEAAVTQVGLLHTPERPL